MAAGKYACLSFMRNDGLHGDSFLFQVQTVFIYAMVETVRNA